MNQISETNPNYIKFKSILLLGVYIVLMIVAAVVFNRYVDKDTLQVVVEKAGHMGILVYALVEVIYVTFTPLLNTFILIVSGFIFGGHVGFIINFLSTIVGLFLIVFLET